MNHVLNLIDELSQLLISNYDLSHLLEKSVALIAEYLDVNVCSIYLFEEKSRKLVLKANTGFDLTDLSKISLYPEEGLIGKSFSENELLYVENAPKSRFFKPVEGLKEDKYPVFLSIPITFRKDKLGILAIQAVKEKSLSSIEVAFLKSIASQMGILLKNVEIYDKLQFFSNGPAAAERSESHNKRLRGKGVSGGVALGEVNIYHDTNRIEEVEIRKIHKKNIKKETDRFEKTLQIAMNEIERWKTKSSDNIQEITEILESQFQLLKDPGLHKKISDYIRKTYSFESALKLVYEDYKVIFERMENDYLKERIFDIKDVLCRILLSSTKKKELKITRDTILVANEILPSYFVQLDFSRIKGIITRKATTTSHSVILAKAFNIPMITGVTDIFQFCKDRDLAILDIEKDEIIINPMQDIIKEYKNLVKNISNLSKMEITGEPITKDGNLVKLSVNLGLISEIKMAQKVNFYDVGLYRTEFLFLLRKDFPSSDEQYEIYKMILKKVNGKEVTFRTLDLGGDKQLSYFPLPKEENPLLGFRSIRIFKKHPQILKEQLKALLRAAAEYRLRIMFPLINNLEDFSFCTTLMKEAEIELKKEKKKYKIPPLGIMIETPASAYNIQAIAPHVEFISIGSNDLLQYFLAFDRNNLYTEDPYNHFDPAFIRILIHIGHEGKQHNLEVSVCGEMAGNPLMLPVFLHAGFDKLSMVPTAIPAIVETISKLDNHAIETISKEVLSRKKSIDIQTELQRFHNNLTRKK